MNQPLVSIVIPVYNVSKWLTKCLDSCINQTYSNIEIIAVNDGSTDNSKDIILRKLENDRRIKLIDKPNGGVNSARKTGIESVLGEYVTLLDGDDFLEPDALESFLSEDPNREYDILIGNANIVLADSKKVIDHIVHSPAVMSKREYINNTLESGPYAVWKKLYKTSVVTNKTRFPDFVAGEDLPLTIQWGLHSAKVKFTDKIVYNYVVARKGSVMSGDRRGHVESAFDSFYFTFKFLEGVDELVDYKASLTNFVCSKLYSYFFHPDNQIEKNKGIIKEMSGFIFKNRSYLRGRQLRLFNLLLRLNFSIAHYFVYTVFRPLK